MHIGYIVKILQLNISWFLALPTVCGLGWLTTTFRNRLSVPSSVSIYLEDETDKGFRNFVSQRKPHTVGEPKTKTYHREHGESLKRWLQLKSICSLSSWMIAADVWYRHHSCKYMQVQFLDASLPLKIVIFVVTIRSELKHVGECMV